MAPTDPVSRLLAIQQEEDRRAREALACYRPGKQLPFHMATAKDLILSGGKRSGKTTGVAAEFAARVTGRPIISPKTGKRIRRNCRTSTKSDPCLYWVIGWDIDHIGQTIYRKLFEPGLFRVIKDKATGRWRTYNPALADDAERYDESHPAGPLIPERLIDTSKGVRGFVWENAGARNFSTCFLKNGAIINAFPSSSKHPKQGDAVDGIWIDEDIQNPGHLKEWQDRLTDRNGWLMWSVWPHAKNYALCDLMDKADECKDDPNPPIQRFQLVMSENPFIPKENKELALGRMGSDEEIARRDRGDLLLDTLNMYDFVPALHVAGRLDREDVPKKPQSPIEIVQRILSTDGMFPRDWTRYMAVDPSHTRTAVLFGVVPPPVVDDVRMGNTLIVEEELVVRKHSADQLAVKVRDIVLGKQYEAFIMDQQIGRQTRVGTDRTVFQIYTEAFQKQGLTSRTTRSGFIPGCNVPSTRYTHVRMAMALQETGDAGLIFAANKTYFTQKEFNTYRKKQLIVGGEETILDEPANPRKHDCMAALEYLCAYVVPLFETGNAYVSPENYSTGGSPAYRRAKELLRRQSEKSDGDYVHLGPGMKAAVA